MDEAVQATITTVVGIILAIAIMASCQVNVNQADDQSMVEMVKHGSDPIAARCAVKGSADIVCSVIVSKSDHKN